MKHEKRFDCVQMKREIQARLTKELASMDVQQRRQRAERALAGSDKLRRLWLRGRRNLKAAS